MLTIFLRAIILYILVIITLRGMGKRLLGQLQPFEFALLVVISDLIASPMSDLGTPLLYGVLPILALLLLHSVITLLSMRYDGFRRFVSGRPSIVMSQGVINQDELNKLCLSLGDLLEGMRSSGILNPAEADTVILEANGTMNAFPNAQNRPVNTEDLKLSVPRCGMPLALVMNGHIQRRNLTMGKLSEAWLLDALQKLHLRPADALLCTLDTEGVLRVQAMDDTLYQRRVLDQTEVRW